MTRALAALGAGFLVGQFVDTAVYKPGESCRLELADMQCPVQSVVDAAREIIFAVIANPGIQIPGKDLMAVLVSMPKNTTQPTQWVYLPAFDVPVNSRTGEVVSVSDATGWYASQGPVGVTSTRGPFRNMVGCDY